MSARTSALPRLTRAFFAWALVDLAGVGALALGAAYLIEGRASLIGGFPANLLQAWSCVGLGGGAVVVAAIKMLVEVMHANSSPPPGGETP